ncbi:MAG: NUDIX domain-containing protein [Chitinophagales bacterium]
MDTLKDLQDFFIKGFKEYRPGVTVDCAIFGYHEGELKLLLVKNKIITKWCLPGGYVKKKENLGEAAARITAERTGIKGLFYKQFKTFGDPKRNSPAGTVDSKTFYKLTGLKISRKSWLKNETVSVGFYAITDIVQANPTADFLSSECAWFSVNDLPKLGFDHDEMVKEALSAMRIHLYHFPLGKNLLSKKFTLKEIKVFYEAMSGKELNATNFPNKLISLGLIMKTKEKRHIGAHRAPTCYKFNEKAYNKALKEGLVLV